MERTKKKDDELIRWKKTGGGSFRMKNRIIKPGQVFSARLSEIPDAFRHIIIPLDKLPEDVDDTLKSIDNEYSIQHRSGKWYDVVDGNKKVINEKAMSREKALELIKSLV